MHTEVSLNSALRVTRIVFQKTRWFETVTFETMLHTFVTKPKGDLCYECGIICESKPLEAVTDLARLYKTEGDFKLWFESCRKVLRGAMERHWVPNSVSKNRVIGMKAIMHMVFVTTDNCVKFFKDSGIETIDLPLFKKLSTICDPEGERKTGFMLKQSQLPPGMPHFLIELFSLSEAC